MFCGWFAMWFWVCCFYLVVLDFLFVFFVLHWFTLLSLLICWFRLLCCLLCVVFEFCSCFVCWFGYMFCYVCSLILFGFILGDATCNLNCWFLWDNLGGFSGFAFIFIAYIVFVITVVCVDFVLFCACDLVFCWISCVFNVCFAYWLFLC